ncbi:UDP-N-acetylmuramoyl-L-alanyl-D-glutamate--2,6-diaminopimelate ligase [Wolbachia endosymbiont of Brugia malayi]|uniref:Mur ligase family protein n=1 Tax=Wolbachia endosymbiont of Brugia malayi TaxID=80849 RepID=UPI00004C93F8|nr:UDP-N-acetylmuramoyl-L-alanyl-D-glutamate--2,6-diaminopimelate ligase [Wolbachia endosymbiont of Brugia malayi]AAW71080.1 UDP-N-acetylmuramyl tripeptide synthase [Wolbachia endosymbiont strain TRS of Brugia malayi]QCB62024.1 UDP-N-acetylmuramoyl-L-alanyl-D-glutamate--2,6-diaminopimelate ligase [Wolbachia endosymbiont of Brugia malayi]
MILRELLHDIGHFSVIPVLGTGIQQLALHTGITLGNCTVDFNIEIKGVTCNPKKVKEDYLFVCVSEEGERCVGGIKASAIIASFSAIPAQGAEIYIFYPNPREIYGKIVSRFYQFKQLKCVAAVTGTNGKTSVVEFCRQIWQNAGCNAASVGTLGTCVNNERKDNNSNLTTPDADDLYFTLRDVNSKNIEHLALEASSHGIDQYRIHGLELNAAAFTNFSQDHLDYHKDVNEYFEAKKRLFYEVLPEGKTVVLNSDIDEYYALLKIAEKRSNKVITYGKTGSDITLLRQIPTPDGQHLTIKIGDEVYGMFYPVLGQFQAYNLLCAIGIVIASKLDYQRICIDKFVSLPGRMEKVKPFAFVDYAHTPSALKQALLSLKWHFSKKVVLVFGCGGNRDQAKRAKMGKMAKMYADKVIVTDDNPRDEDPAKIRYDILLCCPNALEVGDRREAIKKGINIAYDENMVLLVAGKGHEKFQIIGNKTFEFSDVEVIKNQILTY